MLLWCCEDARNIATFVHKVIAIAVLVIRSPINHVNEHYWQRLWTDTKHDQNVSFASADYAPQTKVLWDTCCAESEQHVVHVVSRSMMQRSDGSKLSRIPQRSISTRICKPHNSFQSRVCSPFLLMLEAWHSSSRLVSSLICPTK